MTDEEVLVGLNLTRQVGHIKLQRMVRSFGSVQDIIAASYDQLVAVPGIGPQTAGAIARIAPGAVEREILDAGKAGVSVLTVLDAGYPAALRYSDDCPIVLYYKGAISPGDSCAIAIVGSRSATYYGLSQARMFARELAGLGCTIISGLARGIDTAAHTGALEASGRTIAVMGNGFNEIYPPENESLAREIASHGAVVTEMPMAAGPMRYNFPRRNRIISGLSLGVLVVEAAPRSGALITVGFALQQGRDVFAVPGKIDSSASEGPNRLIQEGAKLVVTVRDIIEEYPWLASADHRKTAAAPDICAGGGPEERGREGLTCAESELYTIISKQPATFDDLVGETGRRVDELAEILMNMRLKKFITQAGAKFYIRSMHGC